MINCSIFFIWRHWACRRKRDSAVVLFVSIFLDFENLSRQKGFSLQSLTRACFLNWCSSFELKMREG